MDISYAIDDCEDLNNVVDNLNFDEAEEFFENVND